MLRAQMAQTNVIDIIVNLSVNFTILLINERFIDKELIN